MKNLIIIGARGFGREYYNGIILREGYGKEFIVKGFLDDKKDALDNYYGYPDIIDSVENYKIQENDVFTCALGDSFYRAKYSNIILQKGGDFLSLISPKSIIHKSAKIGKGVMISPFCSISSDVEIGDFVTIQSYCNIGHDAKIGNFCSLESYSFMGGFSKIGDFTTLHTRATILPKIKIGNNSIVGAGSVVIRNIKDNTTVFGVPAKKVEY